MLTFGIALALLFLLCVAIGTAWSATKCNQRSYWYYGRCVKRKGHWSRTHKNAAGQEWWY